ncbi:MAG: DUF1330 domain-containing protein [Pseudomonadota bacterium]
MPYGYVVAQITVTDPDAYPAYVAKVQPIIAKFGGEFIVRGGKSVSYEGTPPGDRTVVVRFPSYEKAMEWYDSEDYAEAKAMRMAASTSVQTIVEGV